MNQPADERSKPSPASRRRRRHAAARVLLTGLLLAALAWATDATACPVCFGDTDDAVADGIRWSVVFLGGLVYLLLAGGVVTFLLLRRRARRLSDPRRGLRLAAES